MHVSARSIASLGLAFLAASVLGWGGTGHMVIAGAAYDSFEPETEVFCSDILDQHPSNNKWKEDFATLQPDIPWTKYQFLRASTWPDEIRLDRRDTSEWHYMLVPLKDVKESLPPAEYKTGLLLGKMKEMLQKVKDAEATPADRAEALAFYIHLVGDSHQPLHCVDNSDHGGNSVRLREGGRSLHSYWDALLGGTADDVGDVEVAVQTVRDRPISINQVAKYKDSTEEEWIRQSALAAAKFAYTPEVRRTAALNRPVNLSQAYKDNATSTAMTQAIAASIRLAEFLNKAADESFSDSSTTGTPGSGGSASAGGQSQTQQTSLSPISLSNLWYAVPVVGLCCLAALLLVTASKGSMAWAKARKAFPLSPKWLFGVVALIIGLIPFLRNPYLLLGYTKRVRRAFEDTTSEYYGLPAKKGQTDIPFSPTGDLLVKEICAAVQPQQPVLVIGPVGSGKSRLSLKIAHDVASGAIRGGVDGALPVVVTPADVPANTSTNFDTLLVDSITRAFRSDRCGVDISPGMVENLLEDGRLLVIVDGLSEMPQFGGKDKIANELIRGMTSRAFRASRFIATSRWNHGDLKATVELKPLSLGIIQNDLLPTTGLPEAMRAKVVQTLSAFELRDISPLLYAIVKSPEGLASRTPTDVYATYLRGLFGSISDEEWKAFNIALNQIACWMMIETGRRGAGLDDDRLISSIREDRIYTRPETLLGEIKARTDVEFTTPLQLLQRLKDAGLLENPRGWRFSVDRHEDFFAADWIVNWVMRGNFWPDTDMWDVDMMGYRHLAFFARELCGDDGELRRSVVEYGPDELKPFLEGPAPVPSATNPAD